MKSTNIKLKDLLKLRLTEAEEEKAAEDKPEEKADDTATDAAEDEENPFATADDEGGDKGDDKGEEDKKEAKPEAPKGIVVQFKRPSVKRYNNQKFLDTQGELVGLNKDGAKVKISDGSVILVNFNDII